MTYNKIQFRYIMGALLLTCLFAFGCSGKVGVSGTVTYTETGEVVKFGEVVFMGEKEMGRAVIKNGKYYAGLAKDGEGLRPGKYTVTSEQLPPPIPAVAIPPGKTVYDLVDIYYLEEPITLEIKKRTVCDFTVVRGVRPGKERTLRPAEWGGEAPGGR